MKEEINLLPKQMVVSRERRAYLDGFGRLLQRVSLLWLAIILSEGVIYGAYYYLDRTLDKAQGLQGQRDAVIEEVRQINDLLALVDNDRRQGVAWSLYSEEILNNAPREITIKKLQVKEKLGVLEIEGAATSRSAVLEYKKILTDLSWVARVEAPLQNYAIGPDAGFSFGLVINREQ